MMLNTATNTNKWHIFKIINKNKFNFKSKLHATSQKSVNLKQNKIGTSDLLVSEICIGCMMMGTQNTEAEGHKLLSYAWDHGINFLDTAEMYPIPPTSEMSGKSSEIVGRWIKTRKREDVIVSTKISGPTRHASKSTINRYKSLNNDEIIKVDPGIDKKNIIGATESELRRLNIDEIDLMQFHWPERYVPYFGSRQYRIENERESVTFEEQVETIGKLIKEGKIRYWGLSNESTYGLTMMCLIADKLNVPRPVSIQNSFSLVHRQFESELAEVCSPRHFNISLLPWTVAAGGFLSGKYLNNQYSKNARFTIIKKRYDRFQCEKMHLATEEYVKLAKSLNLLPVQLAYLFTRSRWFVPSTIIGATNLDQLHENLMAFNYNLSEETLKAIDEIYLKYPDPQNID